MDSIASSSCVLFFWVFCCCNLFKFIFSKVSVFSSVLHQISLLPFVGLALHFFDLSISNCVHLIGDIIGLCWICQATSDDFSIHLLSCHAANHHLSQCRTHALQDYRFCLIVLIFVILSLCLGSFLHASHIAWIITQRPLSTSFISSIWV